MVQVFLPNAALALRQADLVDNADNHRALIVISAA
jgi:hypothetical protein